MEIGQRNAVDQRTVERELVPLQRHLIDGGFTASLDGTTFITLDPTTNRPLAEVADGKSADVDAAVCAARWAFDAGVWPRLSVTERAKTLRRIAATLRDHAEE